MPIMSFYPAWLAQAIQRRAFRDLIAQSRNFSSVTWLGRPVWQNVLDLWTMQEVVAQLRPGLIIETGTNRGGSALFLASLLDLLQRGRIITIDLEKLHDYSHARVTFLLGDSTSDSVVDQVRTLAEQTEGPVLVTLDSDHSSTHVRRELDAYGPMVTAGSYCLVQDGVIDVLSCFKPWRPGPLPAIMDFIRCNPDFEIDLELSQRFLFTHHPSGWLRRAVPGGAKPGSDNLA